MKKFISCTLALVAVSAVVITAWAVAKRGGGKKAGAKIDEVVAKAVDSFDRALE